MLLFSIMTVLRCEANSSGTDDGWLAVDELRSGDQYGSISDLHDDGSSDVYVFGVDPIANVGEIKRSLLGADMELGVMLGEAMDIGNIRAISSIHLEPVAELHPGEHHEMMIRTRRSATTMLIRFSFSED